MHGLLRESVIRFQLDGCQYVSQQGKKKRWLAIQIHRPCKTAEKQLVINMNVLKY